MNGSSFQNDPGLFSVVAALVTQLLAYVVARWDHLKAYASRIGRKN